MRAAIVSLALLLAGLVGLGLLLPGSLVPPAQAADEPTFQDGDRVVWLGGTLIEREQRDGYWEAALTSFHPKRNLTFRNLGWSGDTVWGESRAGFGTPADGFRELRDLTLALKPTVIVVNYGANEAYAGPDGVTRFRQGLTTLLDALAPAKARVVIATPIRREKLPDPLPDPAGYNRDLAAYRAALKELAGTRGDAVLDLTESVAVNADGKGPLTLTDNGVHLTPFGYWTSAFAVTREVVPTRRRFTIDIDAAAGTVTASGGTVEPVQGNPTRFTATAERLPVPLAAKDAPKLPTPSVALGGERTLRIRHLKAGSYTLRIAGKPTVTATAAAWAKGVVIAEHPDVAQAEKLRETVIEKNRLYFHRWRPQNVTYLFGFRKHEQGQNAKEVAAFDPLVAAKEAEIAKLRVPQTHEYSLIQAER